METAGAMNSVLLLDYYGPESRMLHQSFLAAGYNGPVVVIEDDGFLPDDVISVFRSFCGDGSALEGKPKYFNQIDVPDYWEISGTGLGGKITDYTHERGRISYREPLNERIVRAVDWLDSSGVVRSTDHYDSHGLLFARTELSKEGKRFCRTWFSPEGKEIIVENFATGDIMLLQGGHSSFFRSKTELVIKLFDELGIAPERIWYNSLSTPHFVSQSLKAERKQDVLFWQEGPRNDIPGNMQSILNGTSPRTAKILVQKRNSYNKLIDLGADPNVVEPLGFIYPFEKESAGANEVLICTNSDQIEKLTELVEALPELHFHVAAVTEMSTKLLDMRKYSNVSLYPAARVDKIDSLFKRCGIYLDINHQGEIISAVKKAFLHNMLILAFKNTQHNVTFTPDIHVYENENDMISMLRRVHSSPATLVSHLMMQKQYAMSEDKGKYKELIFAD